MPQGTLLRQPI